VDEPRLLPDPNQQRSICATFWKKSCRLARAASPLFPGKQASASLKDPTTAGRSVAQKKTEINAQNVKNCVNR
jgi:hypothetical protein